MTLSTVSSSAHGRSRRVTVDPVCLFHCDEVQFSDWDHIRMITDIAESQQLVSDGKQETAMGLDDLNTSQIFKIEVQLLFFIRPVCVKSQRCLEFTGHHLLHRIKILMIEIHIVVNQ